MNRNDRISTDLDSAQADGALSSWYCYSPEGERRWVLELRGLGTRTYSTREVEAYLTGHQQATAPGEPPASYYAAIEAEQAHLPAEAPDYDTRGQEGAMAPNPGAYPGASDEEFGPAPTDPEEGRCRVHLTGGNLPTLRCNLNAGHVGAHDYSAEEPGPAPALRRAGAEPWCSLHSRSACTLCDECAHESASHERDLEHPTCWAEFRCTECARRRVTDEELLQQTERELGVAPPPQLSPAGWAEAEDMQ